MGKPCSTISSSDGPRATDENHPPFTDDDYRHFVDGKPRYDGVADFLERRGGFRCHRETRPTAPKTPCTDSATASSRSSSSRSNAGVPVFESTVVLVRKLAEAGVATAIYSSSRNCEQVLEGGRTR